MRRRLGDSEHKILAVQSNLANAYEVLGREEEAISLREDVYSGRLKLNGKEHKQTLVAALNCAISFFDLQRFEKAKDLLRKTMPVVRRVFGDHDVVTIKMRAYYGRALYADPAGTLDDLHEAVTMHGETERIARRVLGGAHPLTTAIEDDLRKLRAALRDREASTGSA